MLKSRFWVPCVEHDEDMRYFSEVITDAGGDVVKEYWDGEEDGDAYILFLCEDQKTLDKVKSALEDA